MGDAPAARPASSAASIAIDVAPGSSGNVWILDTNRRVQEFTRSGTYVRGIQLGACSGSITPNPLQRGGLDVPNDSVYVAHPCDNSLLRLRVSDLQTQATASTPSVKGVSAQLYSSAPPNTNALYAAQPSLNQVSILQPQYFSQLGTKSTPGPSDVFVDAFGVLFAPDVVNNLIHLYGSDGNEFRTLGRPGSNARRPQQPDRDRRLRAVLRPRGQHLHRRLRQQPHPALELVRLHVLGGARRRLDGRARPAARQHGRAADPGHPDAGPDRDLHAGHVDEQPDELRFVWQRNGSPIAGATSSSYIIQAADVGQNLTCVVTATNAGGSGQASSAAVVPVASVQAPVNQTRPVISGTPAVGNVLSCSQGTWTNSPTGFSYAWIRNGSTVVGSASSYTVQPADAGQVLTCSVTASNCARARRRPCPTRSRSSNPGCTTGTTGVSINSAAPFTTSPGVILTIHEPAGATGVVISNDGGFATPTTSAIACGDSYSWTLATAGSDRLPKTVYVRFTGRGSTPTRCSRTTSSSTDGAGADVGDAAQEHDVLGLRPQARGDRPGIRGRACPDQFVSQRAAPHDPRVQDEAQCPLQGDRALCARDRPRRQRRQVAGGANAQAVGAPACRTRLKRSAPPTTARCVRTSSSTTALRQAAASRPRSA